MAYQTKTIPIGTAVLGVAYPEGATEFSTPNTLLFSYADQTEIIEQQSYIPTMNWQGIPVSISQFLSSDLSTSSGDRSGYYFAMDIIVGSDPSTNPLTKTSDINDPGVAKHATWNGHKLQISTESLRYYLNFIDTGEIAEATNRLTFQATPQATGINDELILNDSGFTLADIGTDPNTGDLDYKSISLGGVPITVGRVGFRYYLIISEVTEP